MITLFVDSSRKNLSIALKKDKELLFISNVNSYSKHSNYLLNEIVSKLKENNLNIKDIDNYVVLNGPGSFTGIRVGITACKTFAWALNKNIYVSNNLEALKSGITDDVIISVIPDKKTDSYVGIYQDNTKTEEYMNITSSNLNFKNKSITIVSFDENEYVLDLFNNLKENNNVKLNIINDYNYESVIEDAFKKGKENPHDVKPIYLKKIDAEK